MSSSEIFRMAVHNLWQRRARTLFNLAGIVLGCSVLLMTAAAASGIRNAFHALFDSTDFVRQIYIFPSGSNGEEPPESEIMIDAEISEPRRERIRQALIDQWKSERIAGNRKFEITKEDLDSIRQIPHVVDVVPEATTQCSVKTDSGLLEIGIGAISFQSRELRESVLAGALPEINDRGGVLVNEFLAWRMGFKSDADLSKLVGQPLRIEYQVTKTRAANIYRLLTQAWGKLDIDAIQKQTQFLQALRQLMDDLDKTTLTQDQKTQLRGLMGSGLQSIENLPDPIVTRQFIVRGIVHWDNENPVAKLFRQWFQGSKAGLQVHPEVAAEIYQSHMNTNSFRTASVFVDSSTNLGDVSNTLKAEQFLPQSSLYILDSLDRQLERNSWIFYGIAVSILLTAAVGISNTLILSIVERTPEFGIMKSVGARDLQILKLMIVEGAILGLIGATLAILLSLLIGFCGQPLLRMYVESRTETELAGRLIQFQFLPAGLIVLLSVWLCVIASLLPAWRAARLDPVVAMRRT